MAESNPIFRLRRQLANLGFRFAQEDDLETLEERLEAAHLGAPPDEERYDPYRDPCFNCGAPRGRQEVRNHSIMWGDGDVHCGGCGAYVRMYDSG